MHLTWAHVAWHGGGRLMEVVEAPYVVVVEVPVVASCCLAGDETVDRTDVELLGDSTTRKYIKR